MKTNLQKKKELAFYIFLISILLTLLSTNAVLSTRNYKQIAPKEMNECSVDDIKNNTMYHVPDMHIIRYINNEDNENQLNHFIVSFCDADNNHVLGMLQIERNKETKQLLLSISNDYNKRNHSKNDSNNENDINLSGYVTTIAYPTNGELMTSYTIALADSGFNLENEEDQLAPYMFRYDYDDDIDYQAICSNLVLNNIKHTNIAELFFIITSLTSLIACIAWLILRDKESGKANQTATIRNRMQRISTPADIQNNDIASLQLDVQLEHNDYIHMNKYLNIQRRLKPANALIFIFLFFIITGNIIKYETEGKYKEGIRSLLLVTIFYFIILLSILLITKKRKNAIQNSLYNNFSLKFYDDYIAICYPSHITKLSKENLCLHDTKDYYYIYHENTIPLIVPKRFICTSVLKQQFEKQFAIHKSDFANLTGKQIIRKRVIISVLALATFFSLGMIAFSYINVPDNTPAYLWETAENEINCEQLYYIDEVFPFSYYTDKNNTYYIVAFYNDNDVLQFAEFTVDSTNDICNDINNYFDDENAIYGDYSYGGYVRLSSFPDVPYLFDCYLKDILYFKEDIKEGIYQIYPYALEYVYDSHYSIDDIKRMEDAPLLYKEAYYAFLAAILIICIAWQLHQLWQLKKEKREYEKQPEQQQADDNIYQEITQEKLPATQTVPDNQSVENITSSDAITPELLKLDISLSKNEIKSANYFYYTKRTTALMIINTYLPIVLGLIITIHLMGISIEGDPKPTTIDYIFSIGIGIFVILILNYSRSSI